MPRPAVGPHIAGGRDDTLEIDVDRRLGFLPMCSRSDRQNGRGECRGPAQLPDATHEVLPPSCLKARPGARMD